MKFVDDLLARRPNGPRRVESLYFDCQVVAYLTPVSRYDKVVDIAARNLHLWDDMQLIARIMPLE